MQEPFNPLAQAVDLVGLSRLAKKIDVSARTIRAWLRNGMPYTELSEVTDYSCRIEKATAGAIHVGDLHKWLIEYRKWLSWKAEQDRLQGVNIDQTLKKITALREGR